MYEETRAIVIDDENATEEMGEIEEGEIDA